MNILKELYLRWKWGYPIGHEFRLSPKSREHYILYKNEKGIEVFLEFLQNKEVEIDVGSVPKSYISKDNERLENEDWNDAIEALKTNFEKKGYIVRLRK